MNSKQIYDILMRDSVVKDYNFLGVFPLDLIPMTANKFPCCLVINTKPQTDPGEHWVAVVKTENRQGIYFDSYGSPPFNLPEVGELLDNCITWTYNDTKLQSPYSTVCGQYVIFFLTHITRGYNTEEISYMIDDAGDTYANDALIYNYIKNKYINHDIKDLKIVDFPFAFEQISRNM